MEMPTQHDTRRRYFGMTLFHTLREWARCEHPEEPENLEEITKQILNLRDLFNADIEMRLQMAEATIRKYQLHTIILQPGPMKPPLFAPQYKDAIEAVARAIYDVELARGERASSVLINMMVGKPGSKATPESIRENCRIEPFDHCADEWREYAVSAVAAHLAHLQSGNASNSPLPSKTDDAGR